ncbi:hypothetical protein LOTGIDRAFT_95116, partial [Lottia gigantea]
EKIVIVSRSRNIFENLALEDWLYKNADLNNQSYLLMWKNTPAIVIGRHQNPWYECDVNTVVKDDVDLARRNSGGGAVYHDEGNLNCSFLMARKLYNRKKNLELVVDAVKSKWDVDLTINQREDIILNGLYKVSGTAAKLGGDKSYHHFTLLVDVDKNNLSQYLQSPMTGVKTKATASVISNVMNLNEADEDLTVDKVIKAISGKFLHHQISFSLFFKYFFCYFLLQIPKIENVFPSEISFPGFTKILAELKTFSWIFGKTPNFMISKSFVRDLDSKQCFCELDILVEKGIIQDIR